MRERRTSRATESENDEWRWVGGTRAAPVEGMRTHLPQDSLEHALTIISLLKPLVESISRKDRELASQLRRAANSIPLNIAEGLGTEAGNARLRFETARGSLYEARAALRVAIAWGYISADSAHAVLSSMDVLGGRVYGLARR
jgi:four helix bundle protein